MATTVDDEHIAFHKLLHEQIGREFTAAQQYTAIAIYFDSNHLPQLARRFYAQAVEEREHAMMMVQYLLDRDVEVKIGGVGSSSPSSVPFVTRWRWHSRRSRTSPGKSPR